MVKASKWLVVALAAVLALALIGCGGTATEDAGNTDSTETPAAELAGAVAIEGSDTLVNVAQAWAEDFMAENPNVMITVKGGGSGAGIAALINGTVDFANASREAKGEEIEQGSAAGVEMTENAVARDGIAVMVNAANTVSDLTIEQIGQIYRGEVTNWKEVGGADAAIVLLGRDTSSGTYEFFGEAVIGKDAKYAKSMRNLQSNQAIVEEIKKNPNAIGYVGMGYQDAAAKSLLVNGVEGNPDTVRDGSYPLSRLLYMYSNGVPADLAKAYLDWILSDAGQAIVETEGFVRL